ncbi:MULTISPECIES: helix-turn-helix domain-containing protein [unclassified Desulfovibrio]|uniref:helix-turn-helix domain-containing protein n=1 Tax=unclassified Desulfovibrio TaxID=2593640 RepID=UPI002FDB6EAC
MLASQQLITEKEAASFLNISTKTLQSWRYRNYGPAYVKFSRKIAYAMGDLVAFIESQKITPKNCN